MSNFVQFLNEIKDFKDKPVKLKQIKKILKIQEKSFPPCKNITNYFFQEFSKRTNEEHRTKWHKKDKILFVWTVLKYFELQKRTDLSPADGDWQYLSQVLGVTESLLNLKWISMLKTNLKMAPWNPEEDEVLRELINDPVQNWTQITIDFNKANPLKVTRHAKQIRERWNNYINPDLKKCEWSPAEQTELLELVQEMGKRWSLISKRIVGRTENQVKNQYNSMLNSYRRYNLDNEDIAVNKILASLQGKQYDGPDAAPTKRIRKSTVEPVAQVQEIKQENLEPEPMQLQNQQPFQNMMGLSVFSPMLPFQTPLHLLLQNSPNNVQSPFDITRQTSYSNQLNQLQLFDELIKSSQMEKHNDIPYYMRMFNSPLITHQSPQHLSAFSMVAPQQQQQRDQVIAHPKRVKNIQKELIKFDTSFNK